MKNKIALHGFRNYVIDRRSDLTLHLFSAIGCQIDRLRVMQGDVSLIQIRSESFAKNQRGSDRTPRLVNVSLIIFR